MAKKVVAVTIGFIRFPPLHSPHTPLGAAGDPRGPRPHLPAKHPREFAGTAGPTEDLDLAAARLLFRLVSVQDLCVHLLGRQIGVL